MDKYSTFTHKVDLAQFSVERSELTPDNYMIRIGDISNGGLLFMLTEEELKVILNLWIFELNSAYFGLRSDEYAAHQADDTLDDLVHGADAGGKQ